MVNRTRQRKVKRQTRVRSKLYGTAKRPRLSVYKSNKAIYAQLINDEKGETLVSASSAGLAKAGKSTAGDLAQLVGEDLAKKAVKVKVTSAIFDRGSYKYHGQVKKLAEGARKGGLKF